MHPPEIADRLALLLQHASPESLFHLATALQAAETQGVGGTLIIDVPRKGTDHAQVRWLGGGHAIDVPVGAQKTA